MEDKKIYTTENLASVGQLLGIDWRVVNPQEFLKGLNRELEHGLVSVQTNITDNNDLLTGKIVLRHLQDLPDYYTRLEQMYVVAQRGISAVPHYYGGTIRRIFLLAAVVIAISIPFTGGGPALIIGLFSILIILILNLLAGLTSPQNSTVILSDMVISVLGFVIFEIYAIYFYTQQHPYFFVATEFLAVLFMLALYYSTKTSRGMMQR